MGVLGSNSAVVCLASQLPGRCISTSWWTTSCPSKVSEKLGRTGLLVLCFALWLMISQSCMSFAAFTTTPCEDSTFHSHGTWSLFAESSKSEWFLAIILQTYSLWMSLQGLWAEQGEVPSPVTTLSANNFTPLAAHPLIDALLLEAACSGFGQPDSRNNYTETLLFVILFGQ